MPNKKYYAKTCWEAQDIIDYAEQYDYIITQEQAKSLLKELEEGILDSMVAAGFDVISNALDEMDLDTIEE